MTKSKYSIALLSLFLYNSYSFADGGSGSNAARDCKGTVACPAGQAGSISFVESMQAWDSGRCPAIISGFAKNVQAGYSDSDLAYYLKKAGWSNRPTISRNCVNAAPVFSKYGYDNSKKACPLDKPMGVINTQQKYEIWSDGSIKNRSAWYETSNTCAAIKAQTTEVKPGSETVSCDVYYGTQAGTYTGNVTKTGDNLTIFDPVSGTTNTTFQSKSEDTTSCVKEITTTTKEIIEEDCPVGFLGKITSYLVKAENAQGTVYPYETTPILESNTCIAASTDAETPIKTAKQQDTVLSNLSFTTTSISKNDSMFNELNKINISELDGKTYIMNINADNLSAGAFDKSKITNLVKTFKTKLGQSANVKLSSVPVTLDKYINQDGITQSRIRLERLSLSGTSVNNGTVTVKYVSLAKSTPEHFSFTVKVFD